MMNLTIHCVDRIVQKRRTHPNYDDQFFYTLELSIHCKTWDGQKCIQVISLFSDNPMEIIDADSTETITQDV
jgi:hypothetical protein